MKAAVLMTKLWLIWKVLKINNDGEKYVAKSIFDSNIISDRGNNISVQYGGKPEQTKGGF